MCLTRARSKKSSFLLLFAFGLLILAVDLPAVFGATNTRRQSPQLTCVGHVFWEATNQARRVALRVQAFDPNYLEARIDGFVFGALVDQINRGEIILTASDSAAERTAMSSTGLAPLPDGTSYATAKYIFREPNGEQVWLETSCYLGKKSRKGS